MKKKAAFIDHSFHRKTKCTEFLKELLSLKYNLIEFWDYSWCGGDSVKIEHLNKNNFHKIFFFQFIFPPRQLKKLNCKNIIWFPMYDGEEKKHFSEYITYLNQRIKIFSFSKKLSDKLRKSGLECYYYKYHLKPIYRKNNFKNKRILFWMRTTHINWNTIKKLLGKNREVEIVLKINPDPNQKLKIPSKNDINKYNIEIVKKWLSRKEYNKLLASCNIFIAPRKAEGIGLSFIEALSYGICVIAHNNSTMNEYIIHGKNGYLYDLDKIEELDLSNFQKLCHNAKEIAENDYYLWENTKRNIFKDLNRKYKRCNLIKLFYFKLIYFYFLIFHKINKLNFFLIKFTLKK